MTSPFVSTREAVCPPNLIELAKGFAAPRVAIARAGAPLPMEAAEDATKAGIMVPVFVGEAELPGETLGEYPALYARMAECVAGCLSDVDLAPMVHVADALSEALVKTAEYRYPLAGDLEETIFYTHPTVENRVRAAMEWKAENMGSSEGE